MAREAIVYTGVNEPPYHYNIDYIVLKTNVRLTKSFESEFMARKFVNKLKHSKECFLISCPIFK